MFIIDPEKNSIRPLKRETFSDLGYREREHLQEWIAKHPECLGEELLIIGKEFDGWIETRERLDLLALDKSGNVVVIENKLDDSGKDVVWQSLKYAAYCSTLIKTDVLSIFRRHLGEKSGEAEERVADFLSGTEDIETAEINEGNGQRIILAAAKFRPEVTATCLWLIDHGIDIRCLRVSPFSHGDVALLSFEQVIPPPEAQDFMVKIGQKKTSETRDQSARDRRQNRRYRFWEMLLSSLDGKAATVFSNRSPATDHWLGGATGISGINHNFHFLKDRIRYELYSGNSSSEINKAVFDYLFEQKAEIDREFEGELDWRRLNELKATRIFHEYYIDAYDENNWEKAIEWLNASMNQGISVFQPRLDTIKKRL